MTAYISTGSTLTSVTLSSAFIEAARVLNEAENLRNAANPAVAPKNNVSMTADFDGRVLNTTISLPLIQTLDSAGKVVIQAQDYLGSTYSGFIVGTGAAKSSTKMGAVLEIAQILAAAEKLVSPETDQPNNIQITYDFESRLANISANTPFVPSVGATGQITITPLDYV